MLQLFIITVVSLGLLTVVVFGALFYYRKQVAQEVAANRLIATVNPEYVSTGKYSTFHNSLVRLELYVEIIPPKNREELLEEYRPNSFLVQLGSCTIVPAFLGERKTILYQGLCS